MKCKPLARGRGTRLLVRVWVIIIMTLCIIVRSYSMSQPGVTGVVCSDHQGLALSGEYCYCSFTPPSHNLLSPCLPPCSPSSAQGTLKAHSAGLVSAVADKAYQLKHGTDPDEKPVVVIEFDTG